MTSFFYICFPRKGTLTDVGDGDGNGGQTSHKKNNPKNICFYIVFPRKETLTDVGDGEGGIKNKIKPNYC